MAFAPTSEYRLVVGVFETIFDEDSTFANTNSMCLLFDPKSHDPRRLKRPLRSSRITKSYGSIALPWFSALETALRLTCERLPMAAVSSGSATVSDLFSSEEIIMPRTSFFVRIPALRKSNRYPARKV